MRATTANTRMLRFITPFGSLSGTILSRITPQKSTSLDPVNVTDARSMDG
jgi:hypothetical protein